MLLVGAVVAGALYFGLAQMQGLAPAGGPFDAQVATARIELLKIALASTAGIAAVAGLYVSYRKQRNEEASTVREQDRIFTERFTSAAQLLESDKAAVRLAGLNAIARLADDSVRDRSTCLQTICSYLRLPLTIPLTATVDAEGITQGVEPRRLGEREVWQEPDEWEVRRSALTLITNRLSMSATSDVRWSDSDVDLRDAVLIDPDFSDCLVGGELDASGALICSARGIRWNRLQARDGLNFIGARFTCHTSISNSVLTGMNYFFAARFDYSLALRGIEVSRHISAAAIQAEQLDCRGVTFGAYTSFANCKIESEALFTKCDISASRPTQADGSGPEDSCATFVDFSGLSATNLRLTDCEMPQIIRLANATISGELSVVGASVDARSAVLSQLTTDSRIVSLLVDADTQMPNSDGVSITHPAFLYTTPASRADGYWRLDDVNPD